MTSRLVKLLIVLTRLVSSMPQSVKKSFDADKLLENFKAMNDIVLKARPASTKGIYIKSLTLTSTMAPGIKVNPTDF